jgi:hypothetical protein
MKIIKYTLTLLVFISSNTYAVRGAKEPLFKNPRLLAASKLAPNILAPLTFIVPLVFKAGALGHSPILSGGLLLGLIAAPTALLAAKKYTDIKESYISLNNAHSLMEKENDPEKLHICAKSIEEIISYNDNYVLGISHAEKQRALLSVKLLANKQ